MKFVMKWIGLLLVLVTPMARGAIGLNESTLTQGLKTNATASGWLSALGLVNPLFSTVTATNVVLTGTGAGVEQFFDATGSTNGYVKLSVPNTVGTNYTLLLPSQPATGFLYGTWDGTNTVTLSWNTNGASGSTSAPTYLGITNVPFAWYDARTNVYAGGGTTPATAGQNVTQWSDLSGNGRHLTNNSGASQYVFTASTQNGLAGIVGASKVLQTSQSFGGMSAMTIFVVAKETVASGYSILIAGPAANYPDYWATLSLGGAGDAVFGTDSGTKRALPTVFWTTGTTYIFQAKLNGGLASLRKNNGTWTDAATGGSRNSPATALQLGDAGNSSSLSYLAVVIYNTALSDTDATIVEASLNAAWAVH